MTTAPRAVAWSRQAYRRLLDLYPARFRERYAGEMAQVFAESCRDAYARRGIIGLVVVWCRCLVDLVANAATEHLSGKRRETIVMATTRRDFHSVMSWLGRIVGEKLFPPIDARPARRGRSARMRFGMFMEIPLDTPDSAVNAPEKGEELLDTGVKYPSHERRSS